MSVTKALSYDAPHERRNTSIAHNDYPILHGCATQDGNTLIVYPVHVE